MNAPEDDGALLAALRAERDPAPRVWRARRERAEQIAIGHRLWELAQVPGAGGNQWTTEGPTTMGRRTA